MKPYPALHSLTLALPILALGLPGLADAQEETDRAVFAGGCFWCVEEAFDPVEGVIATTSGYSGGDVEDPTYEQVVAGGTGHAEVVEVEYDPELVDYATLLHVFWRNVDPFAVDRQFCDAGDSYRSAIFAVDAEQRDLAESSRDEVAERFDREIATQIEDLDTFYPAEDYHQDYYRENPVRYRFYKSACKREERLEEIWDDEAGGLAEASTDD
jgi:peptide-methionine (S)-S-oxide reductase